MERVNPGLCECSCRLLALCSMAAISVSALVYLALG
jgi:hypothetical protein